LAKAQSFARPILDHVRERVHAAAPEAQETLKWSAPAFTLDGKILLVMAAFKQHAAINFWRGKELRGGEAQAEGMGQFGKLKSLDDLPPDAELDRLIREAAKLAKSAPAPRKVKHEPKAAPALRGGSGESTHGQGGARLLSALGAARLSRLDRRGEAGFNSRQAHRHRHRMAQRGQAAPLEVPKLLIPPPLGEVAARSADGGGMFRR